MFKGKSYLATKYFGKYTLGKKSTFKVDFGLFLFWRYFFKENCKSQVWWNMPVIPAFRRLRQEDHKFKVSLSYITRHCLTKKKRKL
jgi:hypothetical protein